MAATNVYFDYRLVSNYRKKEQTGRKTKNNHAMFSVTSILLMQQVLFHTSTVRANLNIRHVLSCPLGLCFCISWFCCGRKTSQQPIFECQRTYWVYWVTGTFTSWPWPGTHSWVWNKLAGSPPPEERQNHSLESGNLRIYWIMTLMNKSGQPMDLLEVITASCDRDTFNQNCQIIYQ